jgi:hypothetical protein
MFSALLSEGRQEVLTRANRIQFVLKTLFQFDQICRTSLFGDSTSPSYSGDCKFDQLGECKVALMIIFVVLSVPRNKCWVTSLKYPVTDYFLILNNITHDSCLMSSSTFGQLGKTAKNGSVLMP